VSRPAGDGGNRFLVSLARAPHLGKVGLAVLGLVLLAVVWAEQTGEISFITAGFLAFAGLTATLFLLSLYDLAISVLRVSYRPAGQPDLPEPFQIASDVLQEYVRWMAPLGFVVGIIFGHYFWQ
jgi:hypothetical protein